MKGEVGILNVGAGDTKLTFDPSKPQEVERSAKIVTDMLRRGFVLLIEVGRDDRGPLYRRAEGFDPETCEYIIAGESPSVEQEESIDEEAQAQAPAKLPAQRKAPRSTGRGAKAGQKRVAAASTSAVAVARTAGG